MAASFGPLTKVQMIVNLSGQTVQFTNYENAGNNRTVPSEQAAAPGGAWIPWCDSADGFQAHHMSLTAAGLNYSIWQHLDRDGDHVRYSTNGFQLPGYPIPGDSDTNQDVTLVIQPDGSLYQMHVADS